MKDSNLISPQSRISGNHGARIALQNIAFSDVSARLLGTNHATRLGYRLPELTVSWSHEDDEIAAVFPFLLIVESIHEKDEPATAIAEISIKIHVTYHLLDSDGKISPEDLPHVIGTHGYMHAWPYFRADVQWLTTKLGFPALVLSVVLASDVGDRMRIYRHSIEATLAAINKDVEVAKAPAASSKSARSAKEAKPKQMRRKRKTST